ncbi:PEP-CTERM sorting domain-containing protein [Capilliphycus salinus ALCB114379]|uniref:PEP-CTERM sorting domain-containing protein n=1 Tax=Capilliphycus salinus TaxID=2768948 RepID=UPI0039A5BD9E
MGAGVNTCMVTGEFDEFFVPNLLSSFSIPNRPGQPITTYYQFKYDISDSQECESFTNAENLFYTGLTQFNILGVEFSGGSTLVSSVDDTGFLLNGSDLQATITDISLLSPWNIHGSDYDTLDIGLNLDIDPQDSSLQKVSFDLEFLSSITNDFVSLNIFDNNPNSPTFVSSVPEPSSILGLASLGTLALSNFMRKKLYSRDKFKA